MNFLPSVLVPAFDLCSDPVDILPSALPGFFEAVTSEDNTSGWTATVFNNDQDKSSRFDM